ncbi:MAG: FAD:protein FMN transferase [Verrucomicrobiae bacterium]|nr:FAD:protein FMN transferase [Verrucomicrobiae bacterium]
MSVSSRLEIIRVARPAMGTRFEFVLHGGRPEALRAAGEEALDEIERIENALSLYRPHTDIARINAGAALGPVRVAPETFRLLERARALTHRTLGAFDVTAGPLVQAWGFHGGNGVRLDPTALARARDASGWSQVLLDASATAVRFAAGNPGLLDLGAIGKGYALDRAAEVLREAGVTSALLHGGTSTIVALGTPPGADAWTVAIASGPDPDKGTNQDREPTEGQVLSDGPDAHQGTGALSAHAHLQRDRCSDAPNRGTGPLLSVRLREESLSVSAVWGRAFRDAEGQLLGHVLDPRTGLPVAGAGLAAVVLPSAEESDAVSTALLVLGQAGIPELASRFPQLRCWVDPCRI